MKLDLKTALLMIKHLGARWLAYRFYYALVQRTGLLEKWMPPQNWSEISDFAENSKALAFIPAEFSDDQAKMLEQYDEAAHQNKIIEEADAVLNGEFCLFSFHKKQLGFPPDWHKNAMTGERCDKSVHWSKIADFGHGDIKCIWEINRFPWAFALARAYARTRAEKYAEAYWYLFENWLEENQPNIGVNWKCGQEATFRLMATAFARRAFAASKATTTQRLGKWRKFVAFTAERIAGNIDYALSQNNNHGISECVGLLTACRILPDMPKADKYAELAEKNLINQLESLVYDDGGFSQHSTVYHRVVIHDLTWLLALEKSTGNKLDERVINAADKTLNFLIGITDLNNGQAPLRGPNDGANILPLTSTDFLDFSPAILGLSALTGKKPIISESPGDEALFWLGSNSPALEVNTKSSHSQFKTGASGWYILKNQESRLLFYAPERFIHRPAQADLLHVDVWWKGQPIAIDAGSYSYNAADEFAVKAQSTLAHNSVAVNAKDQLQKVSRFLYLPWPECRVKKSDEFITASHNGYRASSVKHTRKVARHGKDGWQITDELASKTSECEYRLHWLLADYPYTWHEESNELILHTPSGDYALTITSDDICSINVARGVEQSERGWWSPCYYHKEPALSLEVRTNKARKAKFMTIFRPLC